MVCGIQEVNHAKQLNRYGQTKHTQKKKQLQQRNEDEGDAIAL